MITLEQLQHWLDGMPENEHLEFKEAKTQFDSIKLHKYCVALANERGGYLVLGISDKPPRQVVGTSAFPNTNEVQRRILETLHFRVDIVELQHPDGRVLVFDIPSRPIGQPLHLDGASKAASVFIAISATKEAGLIKQDDSETNSSRYARYLLYWA